MKISFLLFLSVFFVCFPHSSEASILCDHSHSAECKLVRELETKVIERSQDAKLVSELQGKVNDLQRLQKSTATPSNGAVVVGESTLTHVQTRRRRRRSTRRRRRSRRRKVSSKVVTKPVGSQESESTLPKLPCSGGRRFCDKFDFSQLGNPEQRYLVAAHGNDPDKFSKLWDLGCLEIPQTETKKRCVAEYQSIASNLYKPTLNLHPEMCKVACVSSFLLLTRLFSRARA
jgi:hypothetical protein